MDAPGQKLRRARERLGLRVRDVEQASLRIAEKYGNAEFSIIINRLSDIETKGTVPNLYKLYSLCAIYRLDWIEVLHWYGIDLGSLAEDASVVEIARTHAVGFSGEEGEVMLPLALDPGVDPRRTTYLSRMIQRWGKLPLLFLSDLEPKERRYGFIGTDDWFMYPLLQPGSFILIDETRQKIQNDGWTSEFDRPIYFLEHAKGYACGWCSVQGDALVVMPHPASGESPIVLSPASDVVIIGQVAGIAMLLNQGPPRRDRS